ncbi:UNVERIFIED_CONTAM: hypothetical protein K2H54_047502 [Gekko kuhli]
MSAVFHWGFHYLLKRFYGIDGVENGVGVTEIFDTEMNSIYVLESVMVFGVEGYHVISIPLTSSWWALHSIFHGTGIDKALPSRRSVSQPPGTGQELSTEPNVKSLEWHVQ